MPISLYVHIPFCLRKCYYCDFYSIPIGSENTQAYFQALHRELDYYATQLPSDQRQLQSIFIGGGTPTCVSADLLVDLLIKIRQLFYWLPDIETTVEANPGTLDEGKLEHLLAVGVNRLSLGVQAFDDRLLSRIGRIHSADQAIEAYYKTKSAGFTNISFDLMYGLPEQTLTDWESTLKTAFDLDPVHLSAYSLKIEPGTQFERLRAGGELPLPDEDEEAGMYELLIEQAAKHEYIHYEVSNFAHSGYEARHNLTYWRNQEYLGIGPGAHSYLNKIRWANAADLYVYEKSLANGSPPVIDQEAIPLELERAETMFLGLRLLQGISESDWQRRFGLTIKEAYPVVNKLIQQELLKENGNRIALTRRGLFVANQVFAEFLP